MIFGDDDVLDGFVVDSEPDPGQVARRLHELRMDPTSWDDLAEEDRAYGVAIVVILLAWLRREGAQV